MEKKSSVFLADDHVLVRQGLKALINDCGNLEVVGEAGDGQEAIRSLIKLEPDLLILDVNMPKMGGLSVVKEIKKALINLKIIILTVSNDEQIIIDAFRSGVDGYCLKYSTFDELSMAMKAVLSGKRYISPEISEEILTGFINGGLRIREKSAWDSLTQREKEILKLVGEGYKSKEMSDYLCISVKTVEKHRANMMKKLNVHTASGLAAYASAKGLVNG
jgi:DNA-binding NarL/FixJ family response regulator